MTPNTGSRGFGIVGTGTIAAMHADAIAALPSARLAAVTDVDASAAVDLGRVLPGQQRDPHSGTFCPLPITVIPPAVVPVAGLTLVTATAW